MATLHMIHGFIGVGKTTFSKKLELENNIVRFTFDEWIIALLGQSPPKEGFLEFENKIKQLIWDIAKKILNTGNDVILDFGFWKRADRDYYRSLVREMGFNFKLYNLQCPEEILVRRVLDRTASMQEGALFIDENAINEFKKYYEPVDPEQEESILVRTV